MNSYHRALKAYATGKRQADVADELGCTQAAVSRYLKGRLPTRELAEQIHDKSNGAVPIALWQTVAAARLGIAA